MCRLQVLPARARPLGALRCRRSSQTSRIARCAAGIGGSCGRIQQSAGTQAPHRQRQMSHAMHACGPGHSVRSSASPPPHARRIGPWTAFTALPMLCCKAASPTWSGSRLLKIRMKSRSSECCATGGAGWGGGVQGAKQTLQPSMHGRGPDRDVHGGHVCRPGRYKLNHTISAPGQRLVGRAGGPPVPLRGPMLTQRTRPCPLCRAAPGCRRGHVCMIPNCKEFFIATAGGVWGHRMLGV